MLHFVQVLAIMKNAAINVLAQCPCVVVVFVSLGGIVESLGSVCSIS